MYFLGHLAEQRNEIFMWIATFRGYVEACCMQNMKKKDLAWLEGREWVNELLLMVSEKVW